MVELRVVVPVVAGSSPVAHLFALLVTMFVGLVKRVGVLRRVQIAVASGRYTYGVEPNLDLVRLRELVDVDPAVACLVLSTRRL